MTLSCDLLAALSPDGQRLFALEMAMGASTSVVKLWEVATGKPIGTLAVDAADAKLLVLSPDGKFLATAGGKENRVKVWDATTGRLRVGLPTTGWEPEYSNIVKDVPNLRCIGIIGFEG